jgi:uncharacterized membrane protein YbaN (DUF454 family)
VTFAEASELTGNILILFDPRQTSEKTLLDELETLRCAPAPPAAPAAEEAVLRLLDSHPDGPPDQMTGHMRTLYQVLGWSSIGIGTVGIFTPGLPTVPFAILGGYFFIRSSPQAHEWLLHSQWFGPSVRDWEERHAVRRSVKYTAVAVIGTSLAVTWLLGLPALVIAAIMALEAIGLVVVLRLPVAESSPPGAPVPQ